MAPLPSQTKRQKKVSSNGSFPSAEESASRNSRWRPWVSLLLRLSVSAAILAWIFYTIFQKEKISPLLFWQKLISIQPFWFGVAIVLAGLSCIFAIVRWHAILRVHGLNLGWGRTTGIFLIGAYFNTFMVGVTGGDISKAYYAARETKHKQTEAVMTVVVDRLIGFLGLFVLSAGILAANAHFLLYESNPALRLSALVVAGFMLTILVVMALGFWRSLPRRVRFLGWLLEKLPDSWRQVLSRAADAYQVYAHHPRVVIRAFAWSIGVHVATVFITIALARGLGLTAVSAGKFFLVLPVINCLTALPVGFSGLGIREGLYLKLLGPLGLQQADAVSLSLLFFVSGLVWNLVGGIVFLFWGKTRPVIPA